MRAGAIDIGTNSTRLLVAEGDKDLVRTSVVTGLGRGIARTGRLSEEGRVATLSTLGAYRRWLDELGEPPYRAVMTAVGRDAGNSNEFLSEAREVLGAAPEIITGEEEARLAYSGATAHRPAGDWVVVDIGGGSTEIVSAGGGVSRNVGSVRITDMRLGEGPVDPDRLAAARTWGLETLGDGHPEGTVIGIAGTWTSLAALDAGDSDGIDDYLLRIESIDRIIEDLSGMTTDEIRGLPGLDPARAPVILGGALVARLSLEALGATHVIVSLRDTLDGIVADIQGRVGR